MSNKKLKMNISSDSEDTVILSLSNEPSDSEVENILQKYITSTNTLNSSTGLDAYDHVNNFEENIVFDDCIQIKKFKTNESDYKLEEPYYDGVQSSAEKSKLNEVNKLKNSSETLNIRNQKALEKIQKRHEAEQRKLARNMEKERKKEEAEKQKLLKTLAKSTKPDECVRHLIVEIDSEMSQNECGTILKETLKKNDIPFKTKSQLFPNLVSWSRKTQTIEDMLVKEAEVSENHFLLIMNGSDFIEHVNKDSLTVHIQNIFSLTKCKHLTVAVVGIEKSKPPQEMAVIEVQMLTKSYFRFVKKVENLGNLVMEVTKAVAQIPYKLKKEEKYKLQNEYFSDSNKDTVRIDKNGNGLGRLWHQMLTMFPLARLETAEAITLVYPTPSSIFEAYKTCTGKKEDLLQDLPIRRAQGPYTVARRIGPELSRKCSNFFCSELNNFL